MNKNWYKDRFYGYECRAVEIINEGLPKRETLKKLRIELNKLPIKIDSTEYHSLWNFSLVLYKKIRRGRPLQDIYRAMTHEMNQEADRVEFRIKHSRAINLINSPTVFFQLDSHPNCADGHLPYEGQVFINEDAASEEEKEYAATHNILSLRDVMFSEPFLITRRNCTHQFIPLPSSTVLTGQIPSAPVVREHAPSPVYRAYYDRKKLLISAGVSKKDDSFKRTVSLIKKYKLR